jgi:hypothetical protein
VPDRSRLFLAGCALLYAPWLFLGYGADDDAYRIVRTGRVLLEEGQYIGSRNPGYLVPELATMALNAVGGSVLSNLGTLAMALVALGAFLAVAERLRLSAPLLLGAGLALHPAFWSNAAATMDHVWGLGFLLAGWAVLLDRRWLLAGVLLGLAVGSRFTMLFAVLGVLAFAWFTVAEDRRHVVRSAVVAGLLGAACYLPSAHEFGWTLGFLEPAGLGGPELWTWPLRIGRWGYKSLYFWGLPTAAFLAGLGVFALRRRPLPRPALLALCLAVPVAYEALFLRFPLDVGYLLPIAPFVLVAVGVLLAERRRWLVAFVVVLALHNVVTFNLARPDRPFGASEAAFGLWVEPGPLVESTQIRLRTRDCTDVACWQRRMGVPGE